MGVTGILQYRNRLQQSSDKGSGKASFRQFQLHWTAGYYLYIRLYPAGELALGDDGQYGTQQPGY